MRKVLLGLVMAAWVVMASGCGEPSTGKSATEKKFEDLYKQYSARFHEKMTTDAEKMTAEQITAEATRIWDDVFGSQKDLLRQRVEEILADLDTAAPINENDCVEVASGSRVEPGLDLSQGAIPKQFLWNPVAAAQMGLNNWLSRLLQPKSFGLRSVLLANAGLFWEVLDRNVDHPRLLLRQGPMLYVVEVSRQGDYYQMEKVRWLRPKSMGPATLPKEPPEGVIPTSPAAPPTVAPTPAVIPPPVPPEKPAGKGSGG